jgi:hypothetical protein
LRPNSAENPDKKYREASDGRYHEGCTANPVTVVKLAKSGQDECGEKDPTPCALM